MIDQNARRLFSYTLTAVLRMDLVGDLDGAVVLPERLGEGRVIPDQAESFARSRVDCYQLAVCLAQRRIQKVTEVVRAGVYAGAPLVVPMTPELGITVPVGNQRKIRL